ncbi:MAG: M20/M25/M40 family metallo-hydrolase [Cyclobacteriaceae bacterium]
MLSVILGIYLVPVFSYSQLLSKEEIRQAAENSLPSSLTDYRSFLQIPNNGNFEKHRNENVNWCVNTFEKLQFKTRVITSKGIPHVLADRVVKKKYKTILFYLQIDGQPVDTTKWGQPNPYYPVLKKLENNTWQPVDWEVLETRFDPNLRIFARSASDSKGPAMAFITALQILNQKSFKPKFNIKVIMDFQEELGSPTLPPLVREKPSLFDADMMLIIDGTRHLSNLPTLTFGARGIATVTLKVFGASRDLHSGQYGNFAPNPVFKLAKLLAEMKDEEGRVTVPGFYDGVSLSEKERKTINNLPEDIEEIKATLGIAKADHVGSTYQEALQYPSLNVRGLRAAWVGSEVRTLVPSEAIAEIDMRLVPETTGERQVQLLKNYIVSKGYHLVDSIPTAAERSTYEKLIAMDYRIGSRPFRTDMDSDIGKWLGRAMQHIFGNNYVKMRTTGGSQPIAPFINTLDIPAVSVRIPNPDNNIHAPNENMRLGNYLEGIQMCLSIMTKEFK